MKQIDYWSLCLFVINLGGQGYQELPLVDYSSTGNRYCEMKYYAPGQLLLGFGLAC